MKKIVKKNQKFSIVPEDIRGASSCVVLYSDKSFFDVELKPEDIKYYKEGADVELFTVVEDGMMYFKSAVESVGDNIVSIKNPEVNEVIQRREHTRVAYDREAVIKSLEGAFVCKGVDISAGGMKFECEHEINTKCDYDISFSLDGKINIDCFFRPIRSASDKKGKFIVSGRFVAMKNIDKIAVVQYCLKKQTENVNK